MTDLSWDEKAARVLGCRQPERPESGPGEEWMNPPCTRRPGFRSLAFAALTPFAALVLFGVRRWVQRHAPPAPRQGPAGPSPGPSAAPPPAASPSPAPPASAPPQPDQTPPPSATVQTADPFGEPITLEAKKVVI